MKRRDEIITGAFVLLGLAVIVVGGLWLSRSRLSGDFRTLTARVQTVGQLRPGNVVTLRGVEIGRVQAVQFARSGVDVVLRVRTDAPLPSHPAVLLRPRSLFGEWGAAIVPAGSRAGMGQDSIPRPDSVLPGQTATDFAQLSDYTAEIASNLQTITQRVEVAFNKETAANLARSIDNFEKASADLVELLGRQRQSFGGFAEDMAAAGRTVRQASADLDSTLARLEEATQGGELQDIFANVQKASGSMTDVASQMQTTMGHVNHVATRADSVLGEFNSLVAGVNAGRGSLGQLASDPDLYENLASTLVELRSLLDELKRNPGKYFKFSIF
ncbi:MAG: MlaD family protein [Candidatus Palauibacterales bacterium]|nr:MlaD family protein [Candidatus Palauibacterales bacterium]MDP2528304.1 MlaD family protein [Candidatus Palauibacterales bacterium]MDP2584071.1 MlaD family protein [Candidatus Palauibacterales bacterium]